MIFKKIIFILFFMAIIPCLVTFAQQADEKETANLEASNYNDLRHKAMDEEVANLIAQKQKAMDEVVYKFLAKQDKARFFFTRQKLTGRKPLQKPAIPA